MKTRLLMIVVISIIITSVSVTVMWTEYGVVCNKPVMVHLQKHSNLFDENFDGTFAIEDMGFPFGVHDLNIQECINHVLEKRKTGKTVKDMLSSKSTEMEDAGRLLALNQINYNSDALVVTRGPAFEGDPGCGAVIDFNSETHWFRIDSISEPKNMTVYSENPMPCQINHSSCFCNAQMEFAALMLDELSYLTPEQEQQVGKRVQKYFETMPHQISLTKFVVGKYNFDMGEKYAGICGAMVTDSADFAPDNTPRDDTDGDEISIHGYFSGYMDGPNLWDFSLSVDNEKLCAISDDAKIFQYEKSGG